ncbi:hypothetical protein Tco_1382373 [Tanacetum coccineum]
MGIRHAKPYTLRGGPSMKLGQRLFKAWQLNIHKKNSSISSKPDRAHICTISGAILPTTTTMFAATTPENTPLAYRASTSTNPNPVISPAFVEANYETLESLLRDRRRQMRNNDLRTELEYFREDYDEEREMELRPEPARAVTPPLRAVSPKVHKRRERVVGFEETQNKGESKVERNNKGGRPSKEASRGNGGQNVNLPPLLVVHKGRSENGKPLQSSLTFAYGGQALPNNVGGNLPSNGTFLSHNSQPFIPASLNGQPPTTYEFYQWTAHGLPSTNSDGKPPIGGIFANLPQGGHVPSTFANGYILPQNGFMHPANIPPNCYPFYTQPMYAFPNMPAYANPNPTGLFPNHLGSVTPFIRSIEDYPLPDGLKMPSYIGSYNGKGDPDNFLHLFEGDIRIQKWLMPVACHMFTYTLKDSARIWWNNQRADFGLAQRPTNLQFYSWFKDKKFGRTPLYRSPTHLQGPNGKMYTWVEVREVATNGFSNDLGDSFERPRKSSWNNNKGQMDRSRSFPYKGESHKLLSNLVKSPREILATERVAKTFKRPPRLPGPNWSKDKTRYCHFHKDYGHETNKCKELKHQIEEAVKTGQLTHLVKGMTKKRENTSDTQ